MANLKPGVPGNSVHYLDMRGGILRCQSYSVSFDFQEVIKRHQAFETIDLIQQKSDFKFSKNRAFACFKILNQTLSKIRHPRLVHQNFTQEFEIS